MLSRSNKYAICIINLVTAREEVVNNIHEDPAYQEGRKSYFENKGRYNNPYPQSSIEYNIFERGWSQALKKTPEITIREVKKTQNRSNAEKTKIAEKELNLKKSKEDYLKNRGG